MVVVGVVVVGVVRVLDDATTTTIRRRFWRRRVSVPPLLCRCRQRCRLDGADCNASTTSSIIGRRRKRRKRRDEEERHAPLARAEMRRVRTRGGRFITSSSEREIFLLGRQRSASKGHRVLGDAGEVRVRGTLFRYRVRTKRATIRE